MAAGNTYKQIASTTLGSAAASVTFSSIAGTYTDLVLVCNPIITTTNDQIAIRLNGDTGTNYSRTILAGNGTTTASYQGSSESYAYTGYYSTLYTNPTTNIFHFMNYSNATTYKTLLGRSSSADTTALSSVNLWRSTSAITSIVLTIAGATNFDAGSTFNLYGITAA